MNPREVPPAMNSIASVHFRLGTGSILAMAHIVSVFPRDAEEFHAERSFAFLTFDFPTPKA